MKNQEIDLNNSLITSVSSQEENYQINTNIFCYSENNPTNLCTNQNCQKIAFMCSDKGCFCTHQHKNCTKTTLQSVLQNIQSKQNFSHSIQRCIKDEIQSIIKLLQNYCNQTLTKINKDFQFLSLNKNEQEFMKQYKNSNYEKMTGKQVWKIIHSQKEESIKKMTEQTCYSLKKSFKKSKQYFKQMTKNIDEQIQKLMNKIEQINFKTEFNSQFQKQHNLIQIEKSISNSKIIHFKNQFKIIEEFFTPKSIKSVNLLYQASKNDFLASKFHQKCDGVADTLTLVVTEFGKKIGGYTPLKWDSKTGWLDDQSMKSFVFSLTEGDKFKLISGDYAIGFNSGFGPLFGCGHDLCIGDKANKQVSSHANINLTYKNEKYLFGDKKSWKRFHGNGNQYHFKAKQWQVWKLQFN